MAKATRFRLWTPIANAFEAYRRRLIAEPKAVYEHIWRLLHIEEALIVTLGSALASRILDVLIADEGQAANVNHLRRMITGHPIPGDADEPLDQNCLTGSIDAWLNVLQRFGNAALLPDCPFGQSIGVYLTENLASPVAFVDVWARIAPVPEVFRKSAPSRLDRLRALNSFRNKLAHVPVSHKVLEDVHRGIRSEIIRLLSADEDLLKSRTTKDLQTRSFHAPLCGALGVANGFVSGSDYQQFEEPPDAACGDCWFQWSSADGGPAATVIWEASPFVRLDEELKVMLLFRANGLVTDPDLDEFNCEFHRYAAEIEPVRQEPVHRRMLEKWFPVVASVASVPQRDEHSATAPPESGESLDKQGDEGAVDGKEPSAPAATETADLQAKANELVRSHRFGELLEFLHDLLWRADFEINPQELRDWTDVAFRQSQFRVAQELFQRLKQFDHAALTPDDLRDWAEIAYKRREYAVALGVFQELAKVDDVGRYNDVARLKHGTAMWQVAESTENGSIAYEDRLEMLVQAIELLEEAAKHVDSEYAARALYQKSKAQWHLWRHRGDKSLLEDARTSSDIAATLVYEPAYVSWNDRVERDLQRLEDEGN